MEQNFCRNDFQGKPNGKARSKRGRTKAALRLKGGGTTEEFVQPLLDPTSLFVEGADVEVPEKKPSLSQKWYDIFISGVIWMKVY